MRNLKRLLSAALAMVMSMSIASVASAAATVAEFSDAGDINYTEAVEVMSTLGVLEGFETGDFQPEGTLTREQAAKIIAYMLLGTENAEKLGSNVSAFTDVAANRWSAGYINYCATNGIIAGNGDGTFAPEGKLTGYAFAKMLLGALGYKADVEGFTGYQWTLKVASVASKAGLLNDIKNFSGNAEITREQASQMALNCIKATLVEYTGNTIDVTTGDSTVTIGNNKYEYVTSNNNSVNANIWGLDAQQDADYLTLQFGEQYFPGLVLKSAEYHGIVDDFARPSNQWIYNKQNIGIYPITPDFEYTAQVARKDESDSAKLKALGLMGYKFFDIANDAFTSNLDVTVNGRTITNGLSKVADIANYTDNGATVLVYNIDQTAGNAVTNVVVMQEQMMSVKKVGTDYVSLEKNSPSNTLNYAAIDVKVQNVKDGDAAYETVSALKEGDLVMVTPLTTDGGTTWTVADAYAPSTVTGKLTRVDTYRSATTTYNWNYAVVVGGETYKVAQWNDGFAGLDADKILATLKDVTLVLDKNGYAVQVQDVGATSNYIVVKDTYQSLVDGKLVTFAQGWDIAGAELNLNIGGQNAVPGDLYYYTNENAPGVAEYLISNAAAKGVYDLDTNTEIKASNNKIDLDPVGPTWIQTGIKFIYVNFDANGGVDSIQVLNGVQNATTTELKKFVTGGHAAQAAVDNNKQEVKAVVIKTESNEAISTKLLYVVDKFGSEGVVDGKRVYGYTVAMNSEEGVETKSIFSHDNISVGQFASYAIREVEGYDNFYNLKNHNQATRSTSTAIAQLVNVANVDRGLIVMDNFYGMDKTDVTYNAEQNIGDLGLSGEAAYILRVLSAEWVDLTGKDIDSTKDLADELANLPAGKTFELRFVFNDNSNTDGFRNVDMVVVSQVQSQDNAYVTQSVMNEWIKNGSYTVPAGKVANIASGVYIPAGKTLTINGDVKLNGSFTVNGNLTINGDLTLNGANLNGVGTVNVTGDTKFGSTIAAGLTVTLNTVTVVNDMTIAGNVKITGTVQAASGKTITITSDAVVYIANAGGQAINVAAGSTVAIDDGATGVTGTGKDDVVDGTSVPAELNSITVNGVVGTIEGSTGNYTVAANVYKTGEDVKTVTVSVDPKAGVEIDTVKIGDKVINVVNNTFTVDAPAYATAQGEATPVVVVIKTKGNNSNIVTYTAETYTLTITNKEVVSEK